MNRPVANVVRFRQQTREMIRVQYHGPASTGSYIYQSMEQTDLRHLSIRGKECVVSIRSVCSTRLIRHFATMLKHRQVPGFFHVDKAGKKTRQTALGSRKHYRLTYKYCSIRIDQRVFITHYHIGRTCHFTKIASKPVLTPSFNELFYIPLTQKQAKTNIALSDRGLNHSHQTIDHFE